MKALLTKKFFNLRSLLFISILLQVIRPLNSSLSDGTDGIRSKGKTSENNGISAKKIAVIGAGFSGLTAAAELKRLGYDVDVYDKLSQPGGRAQTWTTEWISPKEKSTSQKKSGPEYRFTFDFGPSWYWMPDLFDAIYERFGGRKVSEFYERRLLDPAYRIYHSNSSSSDNSAGEDSYSYIDVPGTEQGIVDWVEKKEGTRTGIRLFLEQAKELYDRGIYEWIWKPMVGLSEMLDTELIGFALTNDMFIGFEAHLKKYVTDPIVRQVMKWPVIFIGASPKNAPSMYSLMTYGGHCKGTWYPMDGGIHQPAEALKKIGEDMGVKYHLSSDVTQLVVDEAQPDKITKVCYQKLTKEDSSITRSMSGIKPKQNTNNRLNCQIYDGVVAAADYHHVEQKLLPSHLRKYDAEFWSQQAMSPSVVTYYLGFKAEVKGLEHHTFFFDVDLDEHLKRVFVDGSSNDKEERDNSLEVEPTFYVTSTSKTDPETAQVKGGNKEDYAEQMFILVPMPYKLDEIFTDYKLQIEFREKLLNLAFARMEKSLSLEKGFLHSNLVYSMNYSVAEFNADFNSFRGNAFGLANSLMQSLIYKPSMESLAKNLVFAGQLTNPGPGVPPTLVSGIVAANFLKSKLENHVQGENYFNKTDPASLQGDKMRSENTVEGSLLLHYLPYAIFYFVAAHCAIFFILICPVLFVSYMARSYALGLFYTWKYGTTYFGSAILMTPRRFCDTCALYGLFRVADNFVDTVDPAKSRGKDLEEFIRDFWICCDILGLYKSSKKPSIQSQKEALAKNHKLFYQFHPILPCVMDVTVRYQYDKQLFIDFFLSMQIDGREKEWVVCRSIEDLELYMKGSAAVIGDFMLPILMPDEVVLRERKCESKDAKEAKEYCERKRAEALPYARSLGNAFQLTNMIRDIEEDLQLKRHYMPLNLCMDATKQMGPNKTGKNDTPLRLADRNANYSKASYFHFMNTIMEKAEKYYEEADIGIELLPKSEGIQDLIRLARTCYSKIHDEIKRKEYKIFDGQRCVVAKTEKAKIAREILPVSQYLKTTFYNLYAYFVIYWVPTLTLLLGAFAFNNLARVETYQFTYLQFHYIWILPMIFGLLISAKKIFYPNTGIDWYAKYTIISSLLLCFVATAYTTPWDNFLVWRHIWAYVAGKSPTVWFTIAYVPIEEYSYFNLETILVCLLWFWQFPNVDEIKLPPSSHLCKSNSSANDKNTPAMHKWQKQFQTTRRYGYLVLITCFLFGAYCIHASGGICFESVEHFTKDSLYGLFGFDSEYQYYRDHKHNVNQDTELSGSLYLGLILVWVVPIMMLQWYIGAEALIANGQKLRKIIFTSTVYLCISDNWAIHHDVWHINGRYILPLKAMMPPGPIQDWMGPFGTEQLPFEECLFFLVTSIICTWGLHLAMVVLSSWKLNLKRSSIDEVQTVTDEDEDVETIASKINNAPDLLWGTDEKATRELLQKTPEQINEEKMSLSNSLTALGDVHWWGINLRQAGASKVSSLDAKALFTLIALLQTGVASFAIITTFFAPDMFPDSIATNIPLAQIITAVIIPIVVGLIQIQAKQHGAKSLTILYMANMILLGSWIYSWTINLVESSLPLKMSCMLFILCLGWSDAILWSNTSNSNLFVIPGSAKQEIKSAILTLIDIFSLGGMPLVLMANNPGQVASLLEQIMIVLSGDTTDHGHRIEEMVIDIIHFLQPLYLAYLVSIFISIYRCVFYNEDKTGKVGISLVIGRDGINREILHIDAQLMKASQLVATFFLFYLVPTWMSCLIYFIVYRVGLIGGMSLIKTKLVEEAAKIKIE